MFGADSTGLRNLFVSLAVLCIEAHRQVHLEGAEHNCTPLRGALRAMARSSPPPQGAATRHDTDTAIDYLTLYFASTTSALSDVGALQKSWQRLTDAQRLAAIMLTIAHTRVELAALGPRFNDLLTHTITRAPVPEDTFAHFFAALWATAVIRHDQPAEIQTAERIAQFPGSTVARDLTWICIRTVACAIQPGTTAAPPPAAVGCPCPDGIAAAGQLSDWVSSAAAGTAQVHSSFEAAFRQLLSTDPNVVRHMVLVAVYWMTSDWHDTHLPSGS